tara:strand:- start:179727 stop:180236 length:510 start_codon:yes stop_codon:yes gene_type:complete
VFSLWKKLRHFNSRDQFLDWFFAQSQHQWMQSSRYIKIHFMDFFETVPLKTINKLFTERDIYFVPSNGKYSCSVSSKHEEVIIVFPELLKLLSAPFDGYAKAILSHELGHIFCEHSSKHIDPMQAQVEADAFCIELGYGEQLAEFLEEQFESVEKRVRLSYVTSSLFSH